MMRVPPELLGYKAMGNMAQTCRKWPRHQGADFAVERQGSRMRQTADLEHVLACTPRSSEIWMRRDRFVFTQSDPFCGIDLDQCRAANGIITPEARELIRRFDSYTELSPSGTGAHILISAKLAAEDEDQERSRCMILAGISRLLEST